MSKQSKSESKKAAYTAYKAQDRTAKNKTRRLERHLKAHPEDAQAAAALKRGVGRTRKTPNTKVWSGQKRYMAQLYKSIGQNGHYALEHPAVDARIAREEQRKREALDESRKKAA